MTTERRATRPRKWGENPHRKSARCQQKRIERRRAKERNRKQVNQRKRGR